VKIDKSCPVTCDQAKGHFEANKAAGKAKATAAAAPSSASDEIRIVVNVAADIAVVEPFPARSPYLVLHYFAI
jgi:hypothetical protein